MTAVHTVGVVHTHDPVDRAIGVALGLGLGLGRVTLGSRGVVAGRQTAFASDAGAVLPLLLWGQLLLLCSVAVSIGWVRWGRASTWLVGAPVVPAVAGEVADTASRLLPNLM